MIDLSQPRCGNTSTHHEAALRSFIEKRYSQHIEKCNRVIEAAGEVGRSLVASGSEAEPTANSQQVGDQLAAVHSRSVISCGERRGRRKRPSLTDSCPSVLKAVSKRQTVMAMQLSLRAEIQASSNVGQSEQRTSEGASTNYSQP